MTPTASIIVVTWNGLALLQRCLASLEPELRDDVEIVVVDNGSHDGTAAWVQKHAPAARLIRLDHNLGFSGGVNVGLRAAQGDALILLNNDAVALPGFVRAISAPLEDDPALGAVGGVLLVEQRPEQIASAGVQVGRDGLALDLWALQPATSLPSAITPIFGPSGGAACLRRTMLEDVGLLADSFFAYLEDVDLAWRMRLRRWEAVVAPQAQVLHAYSATAGHGSPFKDRMLSRNRLRTIVRCVPDELLPAQLPAIIAYDVQAALFGVLTSRPWIWRGRLEALRELPALLQQRRSIQARRTATAAALERWLAPARTPWAVLAERRRLAQALN